MYEPDDYTTASLVLWWQHLTRHQRAASSVIHTLLSGTACRSKRDKQTLSSARYTRVNTSRDTVIFAGDVCVYRITQSARRDVNNVNWIICREQCVLTALTQQEMTVFLCAPSVCQRSLGLKEKQTSLLPLMVLWCFVIIRHLLISPLTTCPYSHYLLNNTFTMWECK